MVKSAAFTGPILEQALEEGRLIKGKPESGAYQGIPATVVPLIVDGNVIAAFGIVDTTGVLGIKDTLALLLAFDDQPSLIKKSLCSL